MLDMLVDIFERNKKLTDFLRENSPRGDMPEDFIKGMMKKGVLDKEEGESYLHELRTVRNSLALYGEVAEFVDEIPWKWWGRGTWKENKEAASEELIDVLHFLMIAFYDLGITPEEIYAKYCEKNETNWERFKKKIGWKESQR